jgi:Zn-dependent protease with chaperone function
MDALTFLSAAIGTALVQALWQDTAIALAAAGLLAALAGRRAATRHAVGLVLLLAMVVLPIATTVDRLDDLSARPVASWQPPTRGDALGHPAARRAGAARSRTVTALEPSMSFAPPPWVAPLWLVGVLAMLVRLARSSRDLRRLDRVQSAPLPAPWQARVDRLRERLGLRRPVDVRVLPGLDQPFTARARRPVVWLPAQLLTGLEVDQLQALLAHELAHVRRLDWVWNAVQCAAEALLFFHPAAWWLGRRVRQERENACDDLAAVACGDALVLAEALTSLERRRRDADAGLSGLVLTAGGGSALERVRRLLGARPNGRPGGFAAAALVAAGIATLVAANALPVGNPGSGAAPQASSSAAAPVPAAQSAQSAQTTQTAPAAVASTASAPHASPIVPTAPAASPPVSTSPQPPQPSNVVPAATAQEGPLTYVGDSMHLVVHRDDGPVRDYHRWTDLSGTTHETYRENGQALPVDDDVRAWVASVHHEAAPAVPAAPPAPPRPPAPPGHSLDPLPPLPPLPPAAPTPPEVSEPPPPPPPPAPPALSEHPGFQALTARLQHDPAVVARVGSPVVLQEDCHPCHLDDDHVQLNLGVQGPQGHERVEADGHRTDSGWTFDRIDVRAR